MVRPFLLFLFIACLVGPVFAQAPAPRTITVTGEAYKDVVPDQAAVQVTVSANDRDVKQAKTAHDKKLEKLYQIAGAQQVDKKDMKTVYASIQPHYRYNNGEQIFEGYQVNTTVEMNVKETERLGALMQQLVENKFDQIGNVQYRLNNEIPYRDAVLIEALDNARDKAEKLAVRAGGTLGDVVSIVQGSAPAPTFPQPMYARAMAMDAKEAAPAPPVGATRIEASVTATYELK